VHGLQERRRAERTIRQKAKFWGRQGFVMSVRGFERVAVVYTLAILVLCLLEALT
jgi:hypothetical protein